MAANQEKRHLLGRIGQGIIQKVLGGASTSHTAPFDLVDFENSVAYEVKTMSGLGADLKIHIADHSMKRKRAFIREYGIKRAYIIAVVIYSPERIEIYKGALKQSVRIHHMRKINLEGETN